MVRENQESEKEDGKMRADANTDTAGDELATGFTLWPWQVQRIILATHNSGKILEFKHNLSRLPWEVTTSADLKLPEPDETGLTYEENATIKAVETAQRTGQVALADDSGLSVEALGGAPGIYSARWAAAKKDYSSAMDRLNRELAPFENKKASFVCTLVLALPGGERRAFHGQIGGTITWPPRGTHGFGFDPIFVPTGYTETFAELDEATKSRINHRAKAFDALVRCFTKIE
jgi:XTP/dITP diphosphohydrolase